MNMTSDSQAYIHIQLPGTFEMVPAALLKVEKLDDGTCIGRFRYGDRYLERPNAIALDPFKLPLGTTVQEFTKLKGIPGAVRDAGPDAWGRRVIEHKLERSSADLEEIDYLLNGPQDGAGYLSFSSDRMLKPRNRMFNRTHQLPGLVRAARDIEEGKRVPVHILEQLEPGTSMGGARPKATIEDGGRLWIGKFPEKSDRFNLQRVEYATLELARRCGINVTRSKVESIGGFDVLMVERFDREHANHGYLRFGLVSGLTLLDGDENYTNRERWSYPLLADQVRRWSIQPDADRKELFRRMVFNAAVTNNDDHPRNHAMLHKVKGWELAPAYDLVPVPMVSLERRDLAMTIGEFGRTASVYNLLSQSVRFGLDMDEARAQVDSVVAVARNWRDVFGEMSVTAKDIEYIAPAFLPECFYFEQAVQEV
jgi:serine/threonine-protein kinase HipA